MRVGVMVGGGGEGRGSGGGRGVGGEGEGKREREVEWEEGESAQLQFILPLNLSRKMNASFRCCNYVGVWGRWRPNIHHSAVSPSCGQVTFLINKYNKLGGR